MKHKAGFYERFVKRLLDIVLSAAALVILSPILAVTAVLVRVKLGSPVIFKQERPGKNEKIFTLHKFRTMRDARDKNGELLSDGERMTKFGEKLRSMSIDELPELYDILRGKMSIVGPRPLLVEYLEYYTEEEHHRHDVLPGLTGLAQVNGRNNLTWDQKFMYDIDYVNRISFGLDMKIIVATIGKVLKQSDVQVNTQNTEGNLAVIRGSAAINGEVHNT